METPTWLNDITDARLRAAAEAVWARLPEYARVYLAAAAVPIRTMTPEEARAYPADLVGALKHERGELEIVIRPVLVDFQLRFAIAHEFCHVVLMHYLRAEMGISINPQPLAFLTEWEDEQATFLATVKWGFMDEFLAMARTQRGPGPRWLSTYKESNHASRAHLEK